MQFQAILSKTTTDKIKSKILSPELGELVFECYMTPSQFSEMVEKYFEKGFIIEIRDTEK